MKEVTEVKKDCFAYKPGCHGFKCIALDEMYCARGNCKFYKTQAQYDKELEKYPKKPIKDAK